MAKDESLPMHNSMRETLPINAEKSLKTAIDELTIITRHVKQRSSIVAGVTLLNMFSAFYILFFYGLPTSERLMLGVHAAILLLCLLLLWDYDNQRRAGDSLFEEISDELQWHITSTLNNSVPTDDKVAEQRPFLHERVTLRQYALTTNLPLSGRQGPIYYALLNIAIWLITTLFVVLYSPLTGLV
jgi:hypothetical protein